MSDKIAIVDYDAGNLRSVELALKKLSATPYLIDTPEEVLKADKLIFPGVGSASHAISNLEQRGLIEAIRDFAASGRPFLGLCLGSQIIFDYSEEGDIPCLGLLKGRVQKFEKSQERKIPLMGWCPITVRQSHPLLAGIQDGDSFYFVHSYYIKPTHQSHVTASAEYGIEFPAVVGNDNIAACQFHPERSGTSGLRILDNFINI